MALPQDSGYGPARYGADGAAKHPLQRPAGPAAGLPARHCWPLRLLFNLLRSVPELIFASLLVIAVGLGPVAGILALTLHTTGVLARLFVETLENADPAPASPCS